MNTKNLCDNGIKQPEYRQACGFRGPEAGRRFATKSLLAALLWAVVLIPAAANCKTLNDAVTEQLQLGPDEFDDDTACAVLLDGKSPDVLSGNLQNICLGGGGGDNGGSSGGGGAATAPTLPAVVQERLKDARGEEESEASGASADNVLEMGRYGVFISGEYENLDKDKTKFEDGYDSIVRRLTVGGDVQFSKRLLAGLAFDTYGQDGRFRESGNFNFDVDSYRFVAYGSYLPIDNMFVQVSANYGITSTERKRFASFTDENNDFFDDGPVEGSPRSDFDADQYGAFLTTGYNFRFGAVTLTPRAGYEWQRVAYETYRESGSSGLELKFDDYDITSSLSTLGLAGSIAIGTRYGVLVPQASFDWKHQFDLDQQKLKVSFIDDTRSKKFKYENEDPDRDYYEINAGLVFVMPNDFQVFGNYRTIAKHSRFDSDAFTLGLRYDF